MLRAALAGGQKLVPVQALELARQLVRGRLSDYQRGLEGSAAIQSMRCNAGRVPALVADCGGCKSHHCIGGSEKSVVMPDS